MNIFEFLQVNGNLIVGNLLIQITALCCISLVVAARLMQNAALRYNILFSTLISLLLLTIVSVGMQYNNTNLVLIPLQEQSLAGVDILPTNFVIDDLLIEDRISGTEVTIGAESISNGANAALSSLSTLFRTLSSLPPYLVGLIIWTGGFLFLTTGLLRSLHHVEHISRRSRPLKYNEKQCLDRLVAPHLDAGTALHYRASEFVSSPMLVGLSNPVILLPDLFIERLTEAQLRSVLLHELAHYRRKDGMANFIQKVILAIFWFHPLVHIFDRMLSQAREEICDNYVINCEKPTNYGETLLQVGAFSSNQNLAVQPSHAAVGVLGSSWKLESRIRDLLSERRDKTVQLDAWVKQLIQLSIVGTSLLLAACQIGLADQDEQQPPKTEIQAPVPEATEVPIAANRENRPPPQARTQGSTLGPEIMRAISEIQELMGPADENIEPNLELAKEKLDALYDQRFDRMNSFEKATLLNFYTNYYLSLEDYAGAREIFEELLTIEPLREDVRLRTLRSLGQLYAADEQWQESINKYNEWRDISSQENNLVYRGLSYGHYQLEQFDQALPYWLDYMDSTQAEGAELGRADYAYLNGLYFSLDDYESALEVTKDMILLFNHPTDWNNLRVIHRALDVDLPATDEPDSNASNSNYEANDLAIDNATFMETDGDYLPLVAVAPQYPARAAQRGIEGWVLVSFTVDGVGDVMADSISVVDAEPPEIFNRSAIRATERFKFQPRVLNGEGVEVPGVQYLFRWSLNDEV